jgi:DNA-binding MarR family transcriptional regulator
MPVTAQQLAHRRAAIDLRETLVFFCAQHGSLSFSFAPAPSLSGKPAIAYRGPPRIAYINLYINGAADLPGTGRTRRRGWKAKIRYDAEHYDRIGEKPDVTTKRPKAKAPRPSAEHRDYPASEAIGLLMRIALFGLRASFKAQLAKHGVPWSAWYYLRVLWEHDAITQRELTERVGVMQPNTVSALQTMRRAGWVMITRGEQDRRQILVTLTPKGRKLMQRLLPEIRSIVRPVLLENFSAREEKELRRLLNKVCDNVRLKPPS